MKTAKELAAQMLAECDSTGSADYDTISIVREDDGTYSIGDNGEGADELSRDQALQCLINDITDSVQWLTDMTEEIESIVSGEEGEIFEWLENGSFTGDETPEKLAADWQEREDEAAEATEVYD